MRTRTVDRLSAGEWQRVLLAQSLARVEAPRGPLDIIALCHPTDYIEAIRDASPAEGLVRLDADTAMSPGSFEAALRAVGGAKLAVDEVIAGKASNAFVSTRPPGHHTETARPIATLEHAEPSSAAVECASTWRMRSDRRLRLGILAL